MNDDWEKELDTLLEGKDHAHTCNAYAENHECCLDVGNIGRDFIRTQISLAEKRGAEKAVEFIKRKFAIEEDYGVGFSNEYFTKVIEQAKNL